MWPITKSVADVTTLHCCSVLCPPTHRFCDSHAALLLKRIWPPSCHLALLHGPHHFTTLRPSIALLPWCSCSRFRISALLTSPSHPSVSTRHSFTLLAPRSGEPAVEFIKVLSPCPATRPFHRPRHQPILPQTTRSFFSSPRPRSYYFRKWRLFLASASWPRP